MWGNCNLCCLGELLGHGPGHQPSDHVSGDDSSDPPSGLTMRSTCHLCHLSQQTKSAPVSLLPSCFKFRLCWSRSNLNFVRFLNAGRRRTGFHKLFNVACSPRANSAPSNAWRAEENSSPPTFLPWRHDVHRCPAPAGDSDVCLLPPIGRIHHWPPTDSAILPVKRVRTTRPVSTSGPNFLLDHGATPFWAETSTIPNLSLVALHLPLKPPRE